MEYNKENFVLLFLRAIELQELQIADNLKKEAIEKKIIADLYLEQKAEEVKRERLERKILYGELHREFEE